MSFVTKYLTSRGPVSMSLYKDQLAQKLAGRRLHVDWNDSFAVCAGTSGAVEGWEGGSEERAKAILDVLESLERGDYEVVEDD